jgi:molybdopterin-guanine dinucleotide biosynthesis protein A
MTTSCSGVILAGGRSSRLHGNNKAFIQIGGESIFSRLYNLYIQLFDEIIVVSNDPLAYLDWNVQVVTDIFPYRSSLTGVHAGLFSIKNPFAFFSACDAPFLQKDLVKTVLAQIDPHSQIVVPKTPDGLFEPLCAVYAKTCLGPIETQLSQKILKISNIFRLVRTKTIETEILRGSDTELLSFFNVNTPADVEKAESIQTSLSGKIKK